MDSLQTATFSLVFVTAALVACGSSGDASTAANMSSDGGSEASPSSAACDLTKAPVDAPNCVVDDVAIFVDANAKADGSGTKVDPIPTITAAIAKAVATGKPRVYVCDGTYTEQIKLTTSLSIYGGFDCKWNSTGVKPKVIPNDGPAIHVSSVGDLVVLQDLEAVGAAESSPGASAIGALIVHSTVAMRTIMLRATAGQPGAKGSGVPNAPSAATSGKVSNGSVGGPPTICTCADGSSSSGGRGNDGNGTQGGFGTSSPPVGTANDGGSSTGTCTDGTVGADGLANVSAEPIAAPGVMTEMGWDVSKVAASSKNGNPGQGGGGGGAKTSVAAGGGGGGCGGCGGAGAGAGSNGGASIGILSFDSTVTVDGGLVAAGAGGKGGDGGDGQDGQSGGGGGMGGICNGGPGGNGAGGSGGPGGAGGDSIAVVSTGDVEPQLTRVDASAGTPGLAGAGGPPGAGPGTPGSSGKTGTAGRQMTTYHQK